MSDHCILCGKCMEVCPLLRATNREELSPRAKSELCRVLADSPGELSEADVARLAGLCLGCGRCAEVCSQKVDVPGLVAGLRGAHPDFRSWLWKTWLTRARQLWPVGSAAARCVPDSFHSERLGPMLKMLAGLSEDSGLAPFVEVAQYPDTYRGRKVLLFAGCTANSVQGRWRKAAEDILDGLGVAVIPGNFVCCGSGLKCAGFTDQSRTMAHTNLALWREAGTPPVVTFCASCHAGLKGYAGCFEDEAEQERWRKSLLPLSACLRDAAFLPTDNLPERLGYHHPCHAGKADPDQALLAAMFGDRLHATTGRECCGFGGIMRLAAPGATDSVNRECWESLSGAKAVLTGCSACLSQLSATAPAGVRVGHWLEIIR